jgi:hypothetical protein
MKCTIIAALYAQKHVKTWIVYRWCVQWFVRVAVSLCLQVFETPIPADVLCLKIARKQFITFSIESFSQELTNKNCTIFNIWWNKKNFLFLLLKRIFSKKFFLSLARNNRNGCYNDSFQFKICIILFQY